MPERDYNVIHIFKDSVQLIGKRYNRLFAGHDWVALPPVIEQIASALEIEDSSKFHVIHLFIGSRVMFLAGRDKDEEEEPTVEGFLGKRNNVLSWNQVNSELVDALITELESVPMPTPESETSESETSESEE